jgi:hypothetical protein
MEITAIVFAALRGFAVQSLNLMEIRFLPPEDRPDYRVWYHWALYVISPFLGAVIAAGYVFSNINLNPILALNVGASAPVVFRQWARAR